MYLCDFKLLISHMFIYSVAQPSSLKTCLYSFIFLSDVGFMPSHDYLLPVVPYAFCFSKNQMDGTEKLNV